MKSILELITNELGKDAKGRSIYIGDIIGSAEVKTTYRYRITHTEDINGVTRVMGYQLNCGYKVVSQLINVLNLRATEKFN